MTLPGKLVGVASYLLIGHWWEDHANNAAAIKAFITNKIADIGPLVENEGLDVGDHLGLSSNELSCTTDTLALLEQLESRGVIVEHDCF